MKRISPLTYEINLPGATENVNVHINRLKKSPPLADSCDISHEWATKRRGRPRTLAGHPKKAKIVKELQRPMTVIPIEVDVPPPQPRRKRGRPKKAPIVTTELVEAPKFAALRPTETSPPTLLIQPFTPNPHTLIHRPIALSPHPQYWIVTLSHCDVTPHQGHWHPDHASSTHHLYSPRTHHLHVRRGKRACLERFIPLSAFFRRTKLKRKI